MMKFFRLAVWGVAALPVLWSAPANAAEFEKIVMTFSGGDECVSLDKPRATIFRDKRPKKVRWEVAAEGRYWEIRHDSSKPNAAADFLKNSGRLDIKCSQSKVKTVVPDQFIPEGATWPYRILVYECDGNRQGALICEHDPNIDWGDG